MKQGFTLVELAIVIVIIGLLVGGVLTGRELIAQARIRAQISQIRSFETASITFKAKYNCMAGDCTNANTFFSGVANGNGNGDLDGNAGTFYDAGTTNWSTSNELRNFFIQLSKANLVKGTYDGSNVIGQGLPENPVKSKTSFLAMASLNFTANSSGRVPNMATYQSGKNALFYVVCNIPRNPDLIQQWDDLCGIFSAEEIRQTDMKIDDGMPLSGNFFGFGGSQSPYCLNGSSYNETYEDMECQAIYVFDK